MKNHGFTAISCPRHGTRMAKVELSHQTVIGITAIQFHTSVVEKTV